MLTNGSFEEARADGTPYGWHKFGGDFETVSGPATEGNRSLKMTSVTASTKWVYQSVVVEGGQYYELSAAALRNDPRVDSLFLRISFYTTTDGTGSAIESADSTSALEVDDPGFKALTTGTVRVPDEARSARLRLMLRPVSELPTSAYFDAVTFAQVAAPTATLKPTATPSPTPPPSPQPTPGPISPPITPIPTPLATPAPAETEPTTFTQVANGSFEDRRPDGTPYGWRKVGGEIGVTTDRSAHGGSSLTFHSATGSTKWAYQNIRVEPLAFYGASAFAMVASPASEAFLRLSWYQSDDGSGAAMSSDDSADSARSSAFELLATGPVQAPADARSVKVKLMLRPGTEAPTTAYFDAVTFAPTQPPPNAPSTNSTSSTGSDGSHSSTAATAPVVTSPSATSPPAALGAAATPRPRANVTLPPAAPQVASTVGASDSPNYDWAIALSIIIPLIGFAFLGAYELQRPKRDPDE